MEISRKGRIVALAVIVLVASAGQVDAFDFSIFKDPDDGALDLSQWLATKGGFLPVPIIITEPAVGLGFGLAPVFFHGQMTGKPNPDNPEQRLPPSLTIGAAAYTANGTWFVGGGHVGSWKRDTIRYTGFIGLTNVNIDLYAGNTPLAFNIEGGFLLQEVKFRLGTSQVFVGGKWLFFGSTATFKGPEDVIPPDFPDMGADGFKSNNSGLGAISYYDSRDNTFTPDKGLEANLEVLRYDTGIGGDFDYWYYSAKALWFHEFHTRFVLGLRAAGEAVDGDVPFYAYPFVRLRGVPVMRYQNERVLNLEVEGRWRVYKRWSLIGFAGKGIIDGDIPRFDTGDNIVTYGGGFRYLLASKLKLHVGIDLARGPRDTAVYLQMGHAWAQ